MMMILYFPLRPTNSNNNINNFADGGRSERPCPMHERQVAESAPPNHLEKLKTPGFFIQRLSLGPANIFVLFVFFSSSFSFSCHGSKLQGCLHVGRCVLSRNVFQFQGSDCWMKLCPINLLVFRVPSCRDKHRKAPYLKDAKIWRSAGWTRDLATLVAGTTASSTTRPSWSTKHFARLY